VTGADTPTFPCGACRQVLWDQCRDIEVVSGTTSGLVERTRLSALLPHAFELEDVE
jgi:cytidine deaminase